jgi:polyphenol oxidase
MNGCGRWEPRSSGWMGRRQASEQGGKPGSVVETVRETPVVGSVPRFEIPGWRERYGVVAGITGRGSDLDRGFDLGLWSKEPVGEVMSRWLSLRREMASFPAVILGNQVHGVELLQIDSARGWVREEGIDGWITRSTGILLTVMVADCIPVYLVAPGRGVALLHAGWRGTAGGILGRGVSRLVDSLGADPGNILMHCGVGICGACYEVGSEVLQGCGVPAVGAGPWHFDLREHLIDQGRAMGISQITGSAWCSAHDRPTFYSHRASGGSDGRMVAYIGVERGS